MTTEFEQPPGNETELEIVQNGDFKNIYPKPKLNKGIRGLPEGDYAVITKMFDSAIDKNGQYGPYGVARVEYDGVEVSFFLEKKPYNDEVERFNTAGGMDEDVKMWWENEPYEYDGEKKFRQVLKFTPVQ